MNFDAKNYPPLKDIDNLKERNHSMVLYDNEDYGKSVKYRYIENGLKKGEHSIILTHDDVNSIENEVASYGIDVDNFKRKKLLHIHQIEIGILDTLLERVHPSLNRPGRHIL